VKFLASGSRRWVAILLLAGLAVLAWETMDPGQVRWLVMILLGGFALRILLTPGSREEAGPRYDGDVPPQ
jgi:hypothetical protein